MLPPTVLRVRTGFSRLTLGMRLARFLLAFPASLDRFVCMITASFIWFGSLPRRKRAAHRFSAQWVVWHFSLGQVTKLPPRVLRVRTGFSRLTLGMRLARFLLAFPASLDRFVCMITASFIWFVGSRRCHPSAAGTGSNTRTRRKRRRNCARARLPRRSRAAHRFFAQWMPELLHR